MLAFFDVRGKVEKLKTENNMFTDAPGKNVSTEGR